MKKKIYSATFNSFIRDKLKKKKIRFPTFIKLMGRSQNTIYNKVYYPLTFSAEEIIKIAEIIEEPPEYIIRYITEDNNERRKYSK